MAVSAELKITRTELTSDKIPELYELFELKSLPIADAEVEVIIKNISLAAINGLRRVLTDEMHGCILRVPIDGYKLESDELTMYPQFVNQRISSLRLRPMIQDDLINELELSLNVHNLDSIVKDVYAGDLSVTAGKLPELPLFNPTVKLATLQPGKKIVIKNIKLARGYGTDSGLYNVVARASFTHLDIPQHTENEMKNEDGAAIDLSGYKVSSLVAKPREHKLMFVVPATSSNYRAEVIYLLSGACDVIKNRLRLIESAITNKTHNKSIHYAVVKQASGFYEGILQIPGETHTIGQLLRETVYNIDNKVSNVTYETISHENKLIFTVRYANDITKLLVKAINYLISVFDDIQRDIEK